MSRECRREIRKEVHHLQFFDRQKNIISPAVQEKMKNTKIVIVGIGALGQMVSEGLVRSGFYHLTLIDGDTISYSNFNRQIFANNKTLGLSKVEVAKQALLEINPRAHIQIFNQYVQGDLELLNDCILIDCTDHISSKLLLERLALTHQVPLVHGAIDGWHGQAATIFPEDDLLQLIYQNQENKIYSSLMITAQVVAALQVRNVMMLIMDKKDELKNKMIMIDMLNNEFQTIHIEK